MAISEPNAIEARGTEAPNKVSALTYSTSAQAETVRREVSIGATVPSGIKEKAEALLKRVSNFKVSDVQQGRKNAANFEIIKVYAVRPNEYAIYKSGDDSNDLVIQYSDNPETERQQRNRILALGTIRAELNSLLTGWENRRIYDRKIAFGLQLTLDEDVEGGKAVLDAANNQLLADRSAAGRFQYLKWAAGTGVVMLVLLFTASHVFPFHDPGSNIWLAAKAGLIGAGFSIALGIRKRSVALDLNPLDNITDGALRLIIGVIAAGTLLMLLSSGVLSNTKLGDVNVTGRISSWQIVLVVGFVAGFLERLVPDLLEKRAEATT